MTTTITETQVVVVSETEIQVVTVGTQGPQGIPGAGVPTGGTANQLLEKINGTDYNTRWTSDITPNSVAAVGTVTGSNLSGTNTGDQDLSGLVPKTTTVNGHALSSNVTVTASDVGLGNVTNVAQIPLSYLDTDTNLSANSDAKVASQKATKTYIDGIIAAANATIYKGSIDCSANPNYPAADAGWLYLISVAGKLGGASGVSVEIGDMAVCLTDGTVTGNQATVGAQWNVIQANKDGIVIGPASSTDGNFSMFDGATGKLLKNSSYNASSFLQTANNLSDLASASTARTNLGLGTAALLAATAVALVANNLSDLTSASTARTNLGLGTAAVQNTSYFAQTANNLSDLASASTARTNLGLGTMAVQNSNSVSVTGGAIDGTTIGGTTRAAAAFTNIGIGAAASASNKLLVADVIADPAGQTISSNFTSSTSYSSNNAQQTYGHFVTATLTQGAFNGTNSTASLVAFRALAQTASGAGNTGSITAIAGAIYGANNNGSGTLTTSTALLVNSALNSGAGAITNVYGLVISDQTVGSTLNVGARFRVSSGTGKYNIYADGTAQNFMQGMTNVDNNIVVGSGALSTSATDKFIYGATCAGTPTGVPTSYTGRAASIYDSTNNKWYVYNSGWKFVGSPTSCFEMQLGGSLSNATYVMHTKARFSFIINGIYGLKHTSGTSTLSVKINGTNVTNMSAISVTSTAQDVTASGANTVAVGDQITFVIASGSSPVDLFSTLDITRT